MHLHEYQAKECLAPFGVKAPPFVIVSKEKEEQVPWEDVIVKVQVHAGGRGKAGGVRRAKTPKELAEIQQELLGFFMINAQTGPEGIVANELMITPAVSIEKEYYAAVVLDRIKKAPCLILSTEGGVEIEETAIETPEKILRLAIYEQGKLKSFQKNLIAKTFSWEGEVKKKGLALLQGLVDAFIALDGELIEINPLVLTKDNEIVALDAKMAVDDNALFRHPNLRACQDLSQLPSNEKKAKEMDLAYIALEGNIGCMVNGAGLAMATMDMIQLYGGKPANFLDVGGGADEEKICHGFTLLLNDPQVKMILVNIFGGIMNCETLAKGILQALKTTTLHVPLVVRMEGTNVEKGKQLLEESGLSIQTASDLEEAAMLVVGQK